MMKVFRVLCVVRGPPVWPSVVAGRRPIFAGERSEQFENVPGKTVIVLRPAGCRSVADVMRWFATSGLTAPDQIKLKDRDLDSGRWDGASSSASRPTRCYVNFGAGLPAPGQALAPAPGSANPVAAVAPAPLVPSPVVGGAAEEAVRPDGSPTVSVDGAVDEAEPVRRGKGLFGPVVKDRWLVRIHHPDARSLPRPPAKMDALPMVGNTALSLGCAGNMLDEAKAWAESVGAQVMSATPSAGERTTFLSNEMVAPEALFAAWKRQRTSTTNVGVTPCGRSLVLEVRGPVERAVTRPVKVPVRSASREVEVRWRLAPSAAKKTEDLGWRSGRSEMELEVALQAALDEGTIADASAVKWDSGMVFAAPADLVSLKVALFRMEKREKARPAFIGGKAPAAKLASVFEGPAPGDVADAVSAGDADSGHAGDGQAMQPEDGRRRVPWREGTAAAKTASATDTAKSKKREAQPKRGATFDSALCFA
ncbi:hypothetical protein PAPYR_9626 [Paratrimastix pyriformis]|uniref:Uncharacterized protein n=1 Tax=Paratrimastix pyriformis TaxID=342808 RepID=A0ABQ8UDF2_9EUKA|nr:hypothetical protein PAPYR_9626 [Paratrimastix pyriformis]